MKNRNIIIAMVVCLAVLIAASIWTVINGSKYAKAEDELRTQIASVQEELDAFDSALEARRAEAAQEQQKIDEAELQLMQEYVGERNLIDTDIAYIEKTFIPLLNVDVRQEGQRPSGNAPDELATRLKEKCGVDKGSSFIKNYAIETQYCTEGSWFNEYLGIDYYHVNEFYARPYKVDNDGTREYYCVVQYYASPDETNVQEYICGFFCTLTGEGDKISYKIGEGYRVE